MKPITFESIRNFIKTKKKNKKDGADTSFKRSDSFKRISIRKSYLDRGRNKRSAAAAVAARAAAAASVVVVQQHQQQPPLQSRAGGSTTADAAALVHSSRQQQEAQHHEQEQPKGSRHQARALSVVNEDGGNTTNEDQLYRNKSLQEINEICGGGSVENCSAAGNAHHRIAEEPSYDVIGRRRATTSKLGGSEVQMVEMHFAIDNNSNDSLYDHLIEAAPAPTVAQTDDARIDDTAAAAEDHCHVEDGQYTSFVDISNYDAGAVFDSPAQLQQQQRPSCFMLSDNIYDRADSINKRRLQQQQQQQKPHQHQNANGPASFANISSMYVNHDSITTETPTFGSMVTTSSTTTAFAAATLSADAAAAPASSASDTVPSSITFKTFAEPKVFLETSFDTAEPQSFLHTITTSSSLLPATTTTPAAVPAISPPPSATATLGSTKSNVSRTSLNNNHNCVAAASVQQQQQQQHSESRSSTASDFDSHTFKLPHRSALPLRRASGDGVVIRIPAVVQPTTVPAASLASSSAAAAAATSSFFGGPQQATPLSSLTSQTRLGNNFTTIQLRYDGDLLDDDDDDDDLDNSQEELETSLNGKLTFEIYKELQKSQESVAMRSIGDDDEDQDDEDEEDFDDDEAHEKKRKHDAEIDDDDNDAEIEDDEDEDNGRYEHAVDDDDCTLDVDPLETQFSSLQLHKYSDRSHNVGPDFYDVLPPADSHLPYSVRLKMNPFTRQKELYTVNLGRIWKNLNLGQDDMSLDGTSMQGHFKKKNTESFKSMSSQDSGFSLTLTKPSKGLYRGRGSRKAASRRNNKASTGPADGSVGGGAAQAMARAGFDVGHWQRQPSARRSIGGCAAGSSYGIGKRKTSAPTMAYQPHQQQHQQQPGKYNGSSAFDATLTRTLDRQPTNIEASAAAAAGGHDENVFLKEFEEFCLRRNRAKLSAAATPQFYDYAAAGMDTGGRRTTPPPLSLRQYQQQHAQQPPQLLSDEYEDDDESALPYVARPRLDTFTREINDLEAFFEEHLKRLKEYYLRKKQLTDRTLDKICSSEYDPPLDQLTPAPFPPKFDDDEHNDDEHQHYEIDPLDFSFPYPDKRPTVGSRSGSSRKTSSTSVAAALAKQRAKFRAPEVRLYQPHQPLQQRQQHLFAHPIVTQRMPPPDDYLAFPYGQLQPSSSNRRRIGAWSKRKQFQQSTAAVAAGSITEISLGAHHFPSAAASQQQPLSTSVSRGEVTTHSTAAKCQTCRRHVALRVDGSGSSKGNNRGHRNDKTEGREDNNADADDDDDDDEFSEHEFIVNSIGSELCLDCDNLEADCVCNANKHDNDAGDEEDSAFCNCAHENTTCRSAAAAAAGAIDVSADERTGNFLLYRSLPGKQQQQQQRRVKRKKSKRRTGKNHSTLRRQQYGGNSSSNAVAMSKNPEKLC